MNGLWIPLITPFKNGEIDYHSYKNLIDYYAEKGVGGFVANGTTGECPVLTSLEFEELAHKTVEFAAGRLPVFYGAGGNNTAKIIKQLKIIEQAKVDGILSVCPYYNRPGQRGVFEHFKQLSESTYLDIILYNIPYRTGQNIENEIILKLAELSNIIGIKDSCGNIMQSLDLLRTKPDSFSVLTGEDAMFFTFLAHGAQGGILASAQYQTDKFIDILHLMESNNHHQALQKWNNMLPYIQLMFKEPNPSPIKFLLHKIGLIASPEMRLPMVDITEELKYKIVTYINQ